MSLVKNINKCKKAGTCNTKKNSTVSTKAYKAMKNKWRNRTKKTA